MYHCNGWKGVWWVMFMTIPTQNSSKKWVYSDYLCPIWLLWKNIEKKPLTLSRWLQLTPYYRNVYLSLLSYVCCQHLYSKLLASGNPIVQVKSLSGTTFLDEWWVKFMTMALKTNYSFHWMRKTQKFLRICRAS